MFQLQLSKTGVLGRRLVGKVSQTRPFEQYPSLDGVFYTIN